MWFLKERGGKNKGFLERGDLKHPRQEINVSCILGVGMTEGGEGRADRTLGEKNIL